MTLLQGLVVAVPLLFGAPGRTTVWATMPLLIFCLGWVILSPRGGLFVDCSGRHVTPPQRLRPYGQPVTLVLIACRSPGVGAQGVGQMSLLPGRVYYLLTLPPIDCRFASIPSSRNATATVENSLYRRDGR